MSTSKDSMSLAASVATFDGTNWIMFERTTTAYLRIQGFADLIDSTYKVPRPLEIKELSDNYIKNNDKVMGYLTLRLVPSLQAIVSEYHTAREVWARLKTLYGTPGTALIFVDFMKVINWKFDASHDPSTSISQFLSLIQRLATHKIDLPETVKAMFVLNALPKQWDGMASTMLTTFTTSTLTVENLMPKIMEEWRRRGASSSSVHMARSSLNKRNPMPKWQGNSSAGSSTSFKGSFHKKPKGKSCWTIIHSDTTRISSYGN